MHDRGRAYVRLGMDGPMHQQKCGDKSGITSSQRKRGIYT